MTESVYSGDHQSSPSPPAAATVKSIYVNAVRHPYICNAGRPSLSRKWRHNENDVIMRIAGLVAASTGWRYGDWQQARVASEPRGLDQRSIYF